MPSSARMTLPALTAALRSLLLGRCAVGENRHVLAVVTAMRANHVRALQLAAILAFDVGHRRDGVVRAAHVAARLRNFLLRNCHDTISTTRAAPPRETGACPQKNCSRAYRRGGPTSLAKTSRHRNNLA